MSRYIVDCHDLLFDGPGVRAKVGSILAGIDSGLTPVISSEIISGHPFYGGRTGGESARRLAAIFPDARILVTIREQKRIMASVYMQYLRRGGTMPPEVFFDEENAPGFAAFAAEHFCYHHLVGIYRDLFGPGNVLVLTQEEMARDLAGFLTRLAVFAAAPKQDGFPAAADRVGESDPEFAVPILRRINHFRAEPAAPEPMIALGRAAELAYRGAGRIVRHPFVQKRLGHRRPVSAHVARHFSGRFAASNRDLKTMLGDAIDLAGYEG